MSEHLLQRLELEPHVQVAMGEVVLAREVVNKSSIEERAQKLVDARTGYEWTTVSGEDYHNAVTSLFEELRAAGDVSEIDFVGDQDEIHAATVARLLNAYDDKLPKWDLKRRYIEICEELTVYEVLQKIRLGLLPEDTQIVTVTDYPSDVNATPDEIRAQGYTVANKKGFLRLYRFSKNEEGIWVRHLEQISRSEAITENSTRNWFNQNAAAVPLHATGALHEQFLVSGGRFTDGVVSFASELDACDVREVLYGEDLNAARLNGRSPYQEVRDRSRADRQREHRYVTELEEYEKTLRQKLQSQDISYDEKLRLFHIKQDELVDRILLQRPQMALDARGSQAALHYQQAHLAALAGDQMLMRNHLLHAHNKRDRFSGGSCGGAGKETSLSDVDVSKEMTSFEQFTIDKNADDSDNWTWKKGYCRVSSCKNKGVKTEVGPCDVCRNCQHRFDKGEDPTKDSELAMPKVEKVSQAGNRLLWLIGGNMHGQPAKAA